MVEWTSVGYNGFVVGGMWYPTGLVMGLPLQLDSFSSAIGVASLGGRITVGCDVQREVVSMVFFPL